jgi:arylsulfatase A-like enzyme
MTNIILISVDSLRADRLGCYGYDHPTSPEIDRLAAGGVRFIRAISQATWTLPSHLSLLTSRYPFEFGDTGPDMRAQPEIPHLPELLRATGYATGAVTGGAYLNASFGFSRGFDSYVTERTVEGFVHSACEWLGTAGQRQPFFLFLHTYEVHDYSLQHGHHLAEFESGYAGKVQPGFDLVSEIDRRNGISVLDEADVAHINALYDGEVRCADAALGCIFARLRELELWGDTFVILLSDHGEMLGEHGAFGHENSMYEEQIRVPLIVRGPGVASPSVGQSVDGVVELTDVAPTILEAAGVEIPSRMEGESLWSALRGGSVRPRVAVSFATKVGAPASEVLDEETQRQLRALGYLE